MTARDDALRADLRALADEWDGRDYGACGTGCSGCTAGGLAHLLRAVLDAHEPASEAEHDCASCLDCLHDGHKCCGCYDGACCKSEPEAPTCKWATHYPGETCECEARLAAVTTHTRTSTHGNGPDYCAECSEAISEWVPWPCQGATEPDEPRCHCGKYPLDTDHALALYDSDDETVERHAVGACETGGAEGEAPRIEDDRMRGLYGKYHVERISDPTGKHDDCRYFVLDPQHDPIAETALRLYAMEAKREGYEALANDLLDWVGRCPIYGKKPHGPHSWTDIGIAGELLVSCDGVPGGESR